MNSITIQFRLSQCAIINAVTYAVPLSESVAATNTATAKVGLDATFPSSF